MPTRKTITTTSKPLAARRRRPARVPTADEIASRAYALFVQRGGTHGHDREDWLQAERELSSANAGDAAADRA